MAQKEYLTHATGQPMDGGEAMIRSAIANGVETIFGLPGVQTYPLFNAIGQFNLELITSRHEQGAAFMAMGYAEALGKPGTLCIVPGCGMLYASAGLGTAMSKNTPLLCLLGQIPSAFMGSGRGHLHELPDQTATLKSIIKDSHHISEVQATSNTVNQAFRTMLSGRPGPVAVDMCWDTMADTHEQIVIKPGNDAIERPTINHEQINRAVKILSQAKRPLIVCGGGAQHASAEVSALAEVLQAPVTAHRSGRGVVSEDSALGVSSVAARELFDEVDVVIGIGSRLEMIYMRWGDMMVYDPKPQMTSHTLIRIDIDPLEMERLQPDVGVVAESAQACRILVDALVDKASPNRHRVEEIAVAKQKARRSIEKIQPQIAYLDVIREVLPRDGRLVHDVSQVGFSSYFGFPVYLPRTYIGEGYQGTLGHGFQTALGVKVACPDKAVISITGDGGFMYGVQELATAVAHNIGLITLIFNNHAYGNVRRDQMRIYDGFTVGADLVNPDFVKLAESFGADGYYVDSPQALKPILSQAIDNNRPALINIETKKGSEASPWRYLFMKENPLR